MFDYEKLFKPYTADGSTLDLTVRWLKKSTDADDRVIDQVVSDTMHLLSQGVDFTGKCDCGCDLENAHTKINHFMLAKTLELKNKADKAFVKVLEDKERIRMEARQKQLVKADKQLFEAYHGTWSQRNLPTFRKWLRMKD